MVKVIFELDNELESKFRQKVMDRKGLRKGVIKEAFEEATRLWVTLDKEEIDKLVKKYLPKQKEGKKK